VCRRSAERKFRQRAGPKFRQAQDRIRAQPNQRIRQPDRRLSAQSSQRTGNELDHRRVRLSRHPLRVLAARWLRHWARYPPSFRSARASPAQSDRRPNGQDTGLTTGALARLPARVQHCLPIGPAAGRTVCTLLDLPVCPSISYTSHCLSSLNAPDAICTCFSSTCGCVPLQNSQYQRQTYDRVHATETVKKHQDQRCEAEGWRRSSVARLGPAAQSSMAGQRQEAHQPDPYAGALVLRELVETFCLRAFAPSHLRTFAPSPPSRHRCSIAPSSSLVWLHPFDSLRRAFNPTRAGSPTLAE
jgi:hypothetical protein